MVSSITEVLPILGGIYEYGWLAAYLIAIAVSWGGMNLLAIVVEHRVLIPSQQYASFYLGDLIGLPILVGVTAVMLNQMPSEQHFYHSAGWHIGILILGLAVGIGLMVNEFRSGVYTKAQILSWLKLYHNIIVFPLYIYWIVGYGVPALTYSRLGLAGVLAFGLQPIMLLAAALIALAYWATLIIKDLRLRDAERAEKLAHVAVSPRQTVVAMPAMAVFGASLVLFSQGAQESILISVLYLAGFAYYVTTLAFDSMGMSRPKPWAHVPFKLGYLWPWQRKPWPFWTAGLETPPTI